MTSGASHLPDTATSPATSPATGDPSDARPVPGSEGRPSDAPDPTDRPTASATATGSGTVPATGSGAALATLSATSPTVHVLRVSEHADAAAAPGALESLSAEERERAATFLRDADHDRYVVAHLALRRELAVLLGTDPADVPLTRAPCPVCGGPHGRPSVVGDPLHFSLSHGGDLVLLAFAAVPVGVDVEKYPSPRTAAETASALHVDERGELARLSDVRRPAAFTRCWTRKEAYLKGTGTGLGEDPSVTYVGALDVPTSPPGWHLADLSVPPGHAAASAVRLPRSAGATTR